jgi:hypothetical protein
MNILDPDAPHTAPKPGCAQSEVKGLKLVEASDGAEAQPLSNVIPFHLMLGESSPESRSPHLSTFLVNPKVLACALLPIEINP